MATTFGKELRKLRIDKDETIHIMAKKLGISISYLSAIEAGNRNIPNGMVDKIIEKYRLNKERSEIMRQAEAESSKEIDIDLSAVTVEQRKLVFALSRKLNDISDEDCLDILKKLK
ncbi:MAG: helix-turn-helix transcriptional regulator [Bacilli bacterium]|nr:helix-turn-helix transcriptional regulator [Bacilli bacterium]